MQEFLNIALGFPTVVWTVLLGVVLAYWLFVILGALDLDFLDFDVDLDADFDMNFDVDADVDVDGGDADVSGPSPLAKIAIALGLGRVPVTIMLTFFVSSAWAASFLGVYYLSSVWKIPGFAALIFGLSFVVAVPLMGALAQPFKGMFTTTTRNAGATVIGSVCEVTTGSVTERFGQAQLDDGGAGLLLAIRCETSGNELTRGSQALIIGHDREQDIYWVEPYEQFLASDDDVRRASSAEAAQRVDDLVNAKREG